LLVIPASLIANWIHEINAFFPNLDYVVAHPEFQPDKKVRKPSAETLSGIDLVSEAAAESKNICWIPVGYGKRKVRWQNSYLGAFQNKDRLTGSLTFKHS